MKPEDIEQMKRDREAGTEGPWWLGSDPSHYGTVSDVYGGFQGGASLPPLAVSVGGDAGLQELEANARRIARIPTLEAEVLRLREALAGLVSDFDNLIADSEGVYGLHLNGAPAPWNELTQGGAFEEWTAGLEPARRALNGDAP